MFVYVCKLVHSSYTKIRVKYLVYSTKTRGIMHSFKAVDNDTILHINRSCQTEYFYAHTNYAKLTFSLASTKTPLVLGVATSSGSWLGE